ncbi:hypothetical protein HK097_008532 [Rhizophlyctis rosea]|uniref:STAS domain-containing protein n=1 Tax=Rhizophlyctis rosea TaxID=64517 RepID=A0AAD5SCB8_9FUNG|nr:hypothetical protein HK097_008532 [Rhizophlyctis rosea]
MVVQNPTSKIHVDNTDAKAIGSTVKREVRNAPTHIKDYVTGLFPLFQWIRRYNLQWFIGDLIAGFTVGFLVVPQALAQARIATLPIEYGLYTAFVGLVIYAFFATAKDVTIGPTAVLSLFTSQVLAHANKDAAGNNIFPPVQFAIGAAFFAGIYELLIGLLRLGIVVDFIPSSVITGFTSGAATTIIIQQIPKLMGIKGIDTNTQGPHLILRDIFKLIKTTKVDAAFGFSAIAFLVFFKFIGARWGSRKRWVWYLSLAGTGLALVFYIIVSFAVFKAQDGKVFYSLVGNVPRGFKQFAAPTITADLASKLWSPAITVALVGIVEHVAITKSFGRQNGYTNNINANQEIIALGLTNTFGSFLGGYPATGSFSRSAVKAAAGVRTPAAGWITGLIVVLALYVLTPVFYYIPEAVLSAIIIVAISDLIARYPIWLEFWNSGITDFLVAVVALLATIFAGIENGIYSSVVLAAVILLFRTARPTITTLIRTKNHRSYVPVEVAEKSLKQDTTNTEAGIADEIIPTPPGIVIIAFQDSILYPNAHHTADKLLTIVREDTAFGGTPRRAGDRLWCDDTEEKAARLAAKHSEKGTIISKSTLRAVVLDMSRVSHLDAAGYQTLLDFRIEATRWAGHLVPFHFVQPRASYLRLLRRIITSPVKAISIIPGQTDVNYVPDLDVDPLSYFHDTVNDAVESAQATSEAGISTNVTLQDHKLVEDIQAPLVSQS